MAESTLFREVVVNNPEGLHARPAHQLVTRAGQFEAEIAISNGHEEVDGKSILSILTLAAVHGTQLSLRATGPDAKDALEALVELFDRGFADVGE